MFWWRGVGIHIERKSRGRIPPTGPSFVNMFIFFVEGKPLTLIHTVNAAKPSFPTSIVGIVFTCFGWVGQGSPMKEGFKAYKFYNGDLQIF